MNVARALPALRLGSAVLGATLALASYTPAVAADRCSHDVFTIDGSPVTVALCATRSDAKTIAIAETFTSKSATMSHAATIDLFPGEDSSHGIDDVPLAALGIAKTLHLAMHYKAGTVVLQHALLLPGAVPLK